MKNLIGLLRKRKIIILIIFIVLILIGVLVSFTPAFLSNSKSTFSNNNRPIADAINELKIDAGKTLVAESQTKKLYLDTKTLNIIVEDKNVGTTWNAIDTKSKNAPELSLLNIVYLGEDNSIKEWNSYDYCVKQNTYNMYTIDNGVQIHMNFNEGESSLLYEYMPPKMSSERYQSTFIDGLDALVAKGGLDVQEASKYKTTLDLIYAKSKKEDAYIINYVGNPPISAIKQLIDLAGLVNYTKDMLLQDADALGFKVEFAHPAIFNIVLEVVLEEDELVVRVPMDGMESINDFYAIQNVKTLPNFAATEMSEVEEGYLLVPDGAGALFEMNSYNSKISDYSRDVYDNSYYKEYYYLSEHGEELMMPIFGMIYNEGNKLPNGFLGIIEEGADSAYVDVKLATKETDSAGSNYNKIYPSFDIIQYDAVKVFGEYSEDNTNYLVVTDPLGVDLQIRYLLYPEKTTYFDMALSYKEYLLRAEPDREMIYPEEAGLYISAIGTLSLEKRFMGIPYKTQYAMTTYEDLMGIIHDLEDRNLSISYMGAYDNGANNKLMNKAKLVGSNGKREELDQLLNLAKDNDIPLFLETDFLKIYEKGNGFISKLHGLNDYSSLPVEIYNYNMATGWFARGSDSYHMLNPKKLLGVVSSFIDNEKMKVNLHLEDLAGRYYANYNYNDYISPYQAQQIVNDSIKLLKEDRVLALDNPRMDKVLDGRYAVDISRKSSDYATFYTTIPFRQLVMNGIIDYTTTNVNNNTMDERYYLLQALELGALPKFTISAQSVDMLKNSSYSEFYSIEYNKLKDMMKGIYDEYDEAMGIIEYAKIINHEILSENVFLTEYENGTKVITNYNGKAININGFAIDAYDYYIHN